LTTEVTIVNEEDEEEEVKFENQDVTPLTRDEKKQVK
jgi:hypothetical protein